MNDGRLYRVFRRSCANWKEFARARKTTIRANCTGDEARRICDEYNNNRTPSQIRAGTKYEFTAEENFG